MRFGNHALRVNNLKNTSAVRFNFSKCLKFNADSKNIGSQLVNDFQPVNIYIMDVWQGPSYTFGYASIV